MQQAITTTELGADEADDLLARLRSALAGHAPALASARLERLPDKGLAHDHVRLCGTSLLARIPKQSQLGLPPQANLDYQIACFHRAAASGHTPRLASWLPPSKALMRGALLVEEITGRPAALPQDLPAIARALAAIHALPVLPRLLRAPLWSADDPMIALHQEIMAQARYFDGAGLEAGVSSAVRAEMDRIASLPSAPARPPLHLIAFDGHPGNFIMRADKDAVLVDLEKCRYGYPGLDLAHATLYTSTTWDPDCSASLTLQEVHDFYEDWSRAVGADAARAARPWHVPLRRAMWLWSISWCAKWRVLSPRAGDPTAAGEDWSAEHNAEALVGHVRERVDHYLSAPVIATVLSEFDALEKELAA